MTTYVINPITNELESAQPRQRVADKFKLEDLLTPGPLRDELKEDFDPTQETYEEYLRRINLRYGGRATPKRGLVDEPGSYSQESKFSKYTPSVYDNLTEDMKKFYKKIMGKTWNKKDWDTGNYRRINISRKAKDVVKKPVVQAPYARKLEFFKQYKNYQKGLATEAKLAKKGYISARKLNELLGRANTESSIDDLKRIIDGGRPSPWLNEKEGVAKWKKSKNFSFIEKGGGTGNQRFYKMPNKTTLDSMKNYFKNQEFLSDFKYGRIKEPSIEGAKLFYNDKTLMKALKDWSGNTKKIDQNALKVLNSVFGSDNWSGPNAIKNLGRALNGEIKIEGIKVDKALGKKILDGVSRTANSQYGSSAWDKAAYTYAKDKMNLLFNNKGSKTFRELYDDTEKILMNVLGKKRAKVAIDEVLSLRTGFTNDAQVYSVFSQVIDKKVNETFKQNYDGNLSKNFIKIRKELAKGKEADLDKIKGWTEQQNVKLLEAQKKYPGVKFANFGKFNYETGRFASPEETFGRRRFANLPSDIQKGIKKNFRTSGISIDVGGAGTQKELIKFLEKSANDIKKNPTKFLKDLGMNSKDITKFNKTYGGIPFLDPELLKGVLSEFFKGDFTLDASTTQLGKGALGKSASLLKNFGKVLGKVLGVAALPLEAVYVKDLYDKGKTTAEMVGSPFLLTGRIAEAQDLMKMSPVERQAVSEQQIAGDESMLDTDFYTPMLEGRDEVDVESVRERVAKEREAEEASRILERGILEDLDNQVSTSLAQGGRVGFKDGTPPVIPGNEPDYSELQVMLDNPDKYNTFPKGTFTEELDKAVYGTNEEKTLLQKFNQMFLDPRVYPYYAQKIASGAANIPELAFRFPASLAYLYGQGNLALATADFDKISGKTLMEALEILDPKYTREIKNTKFGDVIGISDKSMNEKDKTEGQKFVGDTFQLGAEAVGPATPFFLFKMFPKLSKQIKDLVVTASAAEKVNKELEKNLAVDQTKRDLILTIGAGGAVAALKFLGLDKLIKAPKATKAVTSAVKSGGTPQYFFDFVDLIKRKGKDVSDRQAVVERQKVIEYKDYTLTDTDGYITIRKTDEDLGRDEMMEYKPPEGVVDEATGKSTEVPAQYEEVTAKPDANDPGNFDSDQGFDSIEDVLDELSKDGKSYTIKELEEMGIIPEALPSSLKPKKAEGGIITGVKSGPAPKSGPTPHGLPYLAKNVTPIKERK